MICTHAGGKLHRAATVSTNKIKADKRFSPWTRRLLGWVYSNVLGKHLRANIHTRMRKMCTEKCAWEMVTVIFALGCACVIKFLGRIARKLLVQGGPKLTKEFELLITFLL